MAGILVFIEHKNGQVKKSSIEAVCEAKRIAKIISGEVYGILIGSGLENAVSQLSSYGLKLFLAQHELLKCYTASGYSKAILAAIDKSKPEFLFLSATSTGRELAPKLAANSKAGLANDCTKIEVEDNGVVFTRPIYAGKAISRIILTSALKIATLRPNVFEYKAADDGVSSVEQLHVEINSSDINTKSAGFVESEGVKVELTEANVVVAGGRGMKAPENFKLIEEFAVLLNGAVGASRAVVDANWRSHECQVGQTGKTVSPNLYIACGISGAIQHLAGMTTSKYIIAINKDPDAPIFKFADYGIVGDCMEVVPVLMEEIKKIRNF